MDHPPVKSLFNARKMDIINLLYRLWCTMDRKYCYAIKRRERDRGAQFSDRIHNKNSSGNKIASGKIQWEVRRKGLCQYFYTHTHTHAHSMYCVLLYDV